MINRLVAVFAFAVMAAFLGILIWHVPRLDLGLVVAATILLAGFDLFQSAGERD